MMKKIIEAILVFILSGIIFFLFFFWVIPSGLSNFNHYFFSTTHDGIKNYYTYLYYLKYDSGFHFSGMAYPYGDLITFTDNQPLLVLTLKALETLGFSCQNNAVTIFNLLLLVGLPLTVLLFYKILKHYKVTYIYAFIIALVLTFLNPQLERLAGHYALAYSFVIPLFWWFDIRLQLAATKKWWLLTIITSVLLLTFLHVYYLAVALLFFFFVGIGHLISQGVTIKNIKTVLGQYTTIAILPMAIFKAFMFMVDDVQDRVAFPYGFLNYRATYRSLFFNTNSPFDGIMPKFIQVGKVEPEGRAYLGVFALAFCIVVLYRFVREARTAKHISLDALNITGEQRLNPYLVLALLALCLGAAFPFYMPPFDVLIEFLTPLAQFRSPGRFAWIFYVVFGVFFHVFLYRFSTQYPALNWRKYILPVVIFIGLIEGVGMAKNTLTTLDKNTLGAQFFEQELMPKFQQNQINSQKFQAIIAFPFYTIGNEKVGYPGTNESIFHSMKISNQTGLPLVNYMMSRTGVRQGLDIMALTSNAILPKHYLNDVSSSKPFLLITTNDELTANEKEMVAIATPLFVAGNLSFYQVSKLQLQQLYQQKIAQLKLQNWLPIKPNVWATGTAANGLVYFDAHINLTDLFNNKTAVMNLRKSNVLFDGNLPATDSLTVSFWTRCADFTYGFPVMKITEYSPDGSEVFHHNTHLDNNYEIFQSTRLVNYTFKPQSSNNKVVITVVGNHYNYSNFLIAKANKELLIKDSLNVWYWNNFPVFDFTLNQY